MKTHFFQKYKGKNGRVANNNPLEDLLKKNIGW